MDVRTLKCLSIRQPYASWIANPDWFINAGLDPKDIENRDWSTRYKGPLLIHASRTFEDEAIDGWAYKYPGVRAAVPGKKKAYPRGKILGIVNMVDCVTNYDSHWFRGDYGFVLSGAKPFDPDLQVRYKGDLGLFDVPSSAVCKIFGYSGLLLPDLQGAGYWGSYQGDLCGYSDALIDHQEHAPMLPDEILKMKTRERACIEWEHKQQSLHPIAEEDKLVWGKGFAKAYFCAYKTIRQKYIRMRINA
jgi:hypothetical protein